MVLERGNPGVSLFDPALCDDDSASVDTIASHSTDLSLETVACLPAGSKAKVDMKNGWIWDHSIQRFMKKDEPRKKETRATKWVQSSTGEWVQGEPSASPFFDEVQQSVLGGKKKNKKKKSQKGQVDPTGQQRAAAAAAAAAGRVAAQAQHTAEKLLRWAGRFPTKIAPTNGPRGPPNGPFFPAFFFAKKKQKTPGKRKFDRKKAKFDLI